MANIINAINGHGGLAPIIRVSAPAGSALTCGTQSYTLGSEEESHDFKIEYKEVNLLPDEYVGLEYIVSDGNSWIDTGITPSDNFFQIKTSIKYISNSLEYSVFYGSAISGATNSFHVKTSTGVTMSNIGSNSNISIGATITTNNNYDINYLVNSGKYSITINNTSYSGTYSGSVVNNASIYLFAYHEAGNTTWKTISGLSKTTIYLENGVISRNFIPCKRISDSAIGMYDTITQAFFENAGTGEFVVGPEKEWNSYETYTVTATKDEITDIEEVEIDKIGVFTVELDTSPYNYGDGSLNQTTNGYGGKIYLNGVLYTPSTDSYMYGNYYNSNYSNFASTDTYPPLYASGRLTKTASTQQYTYSTELDSSKEYTICHAIMWGGLSGSCSFSGYHLVIDGNYYTIKEAVDNEYIKPLTTLHNSSWSSSYVCSNVLNVYTSGSYSGTYGYVVHTFMTNKGHNFTGFRVIGSTLNTTYDGCSYNIYNIEDFRLTLSPY